MNNSHTGDKHKEFAEVLSHKSISFLPYHILDDKVPKDIIKPLSVHHLYSTIPHGSPITCGYIRGSEPFIAYKAPEDTLENPLMIWKEDGCYCYELSESSENRTRLVFNHYPEEYLDKYCYSIKTNIGVLRESFHGFPLNVQDPGNIVQECALYFNLLDNLCSQSQAGTSYLPLSDFFVKPLPLMNICDSHILPLIKQEVPNYTDSVKKLIELLFKDQIQNRPFLVSKVDTDAGLGSARRISYLYESFGSYQNRDREKPLIVYSRTSPMAGSMHADVDYLYMLLNREQYLFIPFNTRNYNKVEIFQSDDVIQNYPIKLSDETKKLFDASFPKELSIINERVTENNSSFSKKIQEQNKGTSDLIQK